MARSKYKRRHSRAKQSVAALRLQAGTLTVDADSGRVFTLLGNYGRRLASPRPLKVQLDRNGYRWVNLKIKVKGRQRRQGAFVHRIVYMAAALDNQDIPKEFDVDHIHGKDAGDGIGNLRLRDIHSNRGDHEWTEADQQAYEEFCRN